MRYRGAPREELRVANFTGRAPIACCAINRMYFAHDSSCVAYRTQLTDIFAQNPEEDCFHYQSGTIKLTVNPPREKEQRTIYCDTTVEYVCMYAWMHVCMHGQGEPYINKHTNTHGMNAAGLVEKRRVAIIGEKMQPLRSEIVCGVFVPVLFSHTLDRLGTILSSIILPADEQVTRCARLMSNLLWKHAGMYVRLSIYVSWTKSPSHIVSRRIADAI